MIISFAPFRLKLGVLYSLIIITLSLILLSSQSYAQGKKNDIFPYINDLIGRPKSEETDAKLKSFELALKKMHNTGDDFPVNITVEYKNFLSLEYVSSILIESPYEKGSYFYPLKISITDFEIKDEYLYNYVIDNLQASEKIYYNYVEAIYYINPEIDIEYKRTSVKKTKNALILEPYYHYYEGKTKNSPYDYTPVKEKSTITGFKFKADFNNAASHANYTKHFTEKAQKRNSLTDKEADIYYTYLYINLEKYCSESGYSFNETFYKMCDDHILPIIKDITQNKSFTPTESTHLLGDYPPKAANFPIFKLDDDNPCSGGNCYVREQTLKFKYGEFTGEFINNKAIKGTFKTTGFGGDGTYTLHSRYKNGVMDSIVFKNIYYEYHAGYNYTTKKWKAHVTVGNQEFIGELVSLDGKIKGSKDDNTVNTTVNLYNFTFGLKSYYELQTENGYFYVKYSDKYFHHVITFLWSAVDVKVNKDKLVFVSNVKEPAIYKSMFGTEGKAFSFKKMDLLELDVRPEYKDYLQVFVENLMTTKEKYENQPLFDFNNYQVHIKNYGQILKNIQNYQKGFIQRCYEIDKKYNRMDGAVTTAQDYAIKTINALNSFFLAFETLQANTNKATYSKPIQEKIKEWEVYKNSVMKHYERLKEAVEINHRTLTTSEERRAYFKKLNATF